VSGIQRALGFGILSQRRADSFGNMIEDDLHRPNQTSGIH